MARREQYRVPPPTASRRHLAVPGQAGRHHFIQPLVVYGRRHQKCYVLLADRSQSRLENSLLIRVPKEYDHQAVRVLRSAMNQVSR
jgi:hypothetical protein